MANILIIGCGYVGTALGMSLAAGGHHVWGMRRHVANLPANIHAISASLDKLADLRLDFAPDYIFYLPSADEYTLSAYEAVYVRGIENLYTCLNNNHLNPARIFYISSTSVYGQTDGSWVDETVPPEPNSDYAGILLRGENLIRTFSDPVTVVRFGGIYGPGREYFIAQVKAGKMLRTPTPLYTNRIHLADCAGLLQFLMVYSEPEVLYLGVDSEPALKNTVIAWIAEHLNVTLPPIASEIALPEVRMRGNKQCSNQKLLNAGYVFQYPNFRCGYAPLLRG